MRTLQHNLSLPEDRCRHALAGVFRHAIISSADSCDYADYAHPLAVNVENTPDAYGITICGSGNGICMTANKHQKIRAGLCWNAEIARLARAHNNANVLSIPARFVSQEEAVQILDTFLSTEFDGGRHQRRIEKIPVA